VVGFNISNRGRRVPNFRGGSAITSATGSSGSANNGSVGFQMYNGGAWYGNFQILPGNDVAWDEYDTVLTLYYWPWRQNQKDLSFDFWWANVHDANPSASRNPLNQANRLRGGHSLNLRSNYVMADVGPHMLDTEVNIGWATQEYTSAGGDVTWNATRISPGLRYFWNRTFGFQVQLNLPYIQYEQKIGGQSYDYTNRFTTSWEFFYAMAPNVLWYFVWDQDGGGVYCKECPVASLNNKPQTGGQLNMLVELNY
jgi:hypothetical protein